MPCLFVCACIHQGLFSKKLQFRKPSVAGGKHIAEKQKKWQYIFFRSCPVLCFHLFLNLQVALFFDFWPRKIGGDELLYELVYISNYNRVRIKPPPRALLSLADPHLQLHPYCRFENSSLFIALLSKQVARKSSKDAEGVGEKRQFTPEPHCSPKGWPGLSAPSMALGENTLEKCYYEYLVLTSRATERKKTRERANPTRYYTLNIMSSPERDERHQSLGRVKLCTLLVDIFTRCCLKAFWLTMAAKSSFSIAIPFSCLYRNHPCEVCASPTQHCEACVYRHRPPYFCLLGTKCYAVFH